MDSQAPHHSFFDEAWTMDQHDALDDHPNPGGFDRNERQTPPYIRIEWLYVSLSSKLSSTLSSTALLLRC